MGSDKKDDAKNVKASTSGAFIKETGAVGRFEAALRGNRALVALVDTEGCFVWISSNGTDLFPGRPSLSRLHDILSSDNGEIAWCLEAIARAVSQGEVARREIGIASSAGEKTLLLSIGPGEGDQSGSSQAVMLVMDVTCADCMARAARPSAERQAKMLSIVAHELRSPLSTIHSGLKILQIASDEAQVARAREMMERHLSHSIRLVDDLLDLARLSEGPMSLDTARVVMSDVVTMAIELSAHGLRKGKHSLTLSMPEEPVELTIDARRITQVISNLLDNAAKYTPDGGNVHLSVTAEGGVLVVRVADNGRGIPTDKLDRIFEIFSQVEGHASYRGGGLGIGLFLVKSITEAHGGTVSVESDGDGQGSTFALFLPLKH